MAAELGLSTSTHSQKLAQTQLRYTTSKLMWKNKQQTPEDDDESWEVRAFEEDTTGNLMGCTWPPRSYTCTFCRREFRSAQALGGHMNVHRRDRARLHDGPPHPPSLAAGPNKTQPPPSTLLIPTQDLVASGLCLLYALPNPNGVLIPTSVNGPMDSLPPLISTNSHFSTNISTNLISTTVQSVASSPCHSSKAESSPSNSKDNNFLCYGDTNNKDSAVEELDLELRLGRKSPSPDKC